MTKNIDNLQRLRVEIDSVDGVILSALAKRAELVREIGKHKQKYNLKLFDRKRWGEIIKTRIITGKSMGLPPSLVREIFKLIHQHSLSTQRKMTKL